jgi:UDP-N-acetylmuramoylalanine--D-glutamate ligase
LVLGADVLVFDSQLVGIGGAIVVDEISTLVESLAAESPCRSSPLNRNFSLAAALWEALELPLEALLESANGFQLAAHRLNSVATWGGVTFWNDSKATNFHAALAAIDAVNSPVYWIGGGSSKGGDLDEFARLIAPKVKMAFLYGEVADSFSQSFALLDTKVEVRANFVDSVEAATRAALVDSPSAVLLSPGFASFDQFHSYAARGKTFISIVFSLKEALRPN